MKFIARAKRRRAGIYLFRTDKHFRRGRENGYVGRSNDMAKREECHLGMCGRHANCEPKDWTDLRPRRHTLIRLPWWASWKWVQAPLEFMAVKLLLPRYNVQLNKRNPRRISPRTARNQRAARDSARDGERLSLAVRAATRGGPLAWRVAGVLFVLAGVALPILDHVR